MNSALKQRLVGAVVLVAIAVIFVPSFLRERQVEPVSTKTLIPEPPPREEVTFEQPSPPEDIEPAPEPETMFLPDEPSKQPAPEAVSAAEQEPSESDPAPVTEEAGSSDGQDTGGATDGRAWVIQVASFREAERANELRDKLQEQGYRAYVRSASTSAGDVNRVFIGPKISREDAESTKAAVDQALKVDALILRFEP